MVRAIRVQLHYSAERAALETAGGIAQALPILTNAQCAFGVLAVSGDVYTDYGDYAQLHGKAAELSAQRAATDVLVMVDNPDFHAQVILRWMGERLLALNEIRCAQMRRVH